MIEVPDIVRRVFASHRQPPKPIVNPKGYDLPVKIEKKIQCAFRAKRIECPDGVVTAPLTLSGAGYNPDHDYHWWRASFSIDGLEFHVLTSDPPIASWEQRT